MTGTRSRIKIGGSEYVAKRFARRLNDIVKQLELRGIGSWCDCPSVEGIHAHRSIVGRLFPELTIYESPKPPCPDPVHRPRPFAKPKTRISEAETLRRLFPTGIIGLPKDARSFAELFMALPLEVRIERFFGAEDSTAPDQGSDDSKELKPSIFERMGYKEFSS